MMQHSHRSFGGGSKGWLVVLMFLSSDSVSCYDRSLLLAFKLYIITESHLFLIPASQIYGVWSFECCRTVLWLKCLWIQSCNPHMFSCFPLVEQIGSSCTCSIFFPKRKWGYCVHTCHNGLLYGFSVFKVSKIVSRTIILVHLLS